MRQLGLRFSLEAEVLPRSRAVPLLLRSIGEVPARGTLMQRSELAGGGDGRLKHVAFKVEMAGCAVHHAHDETAVILGGADLERVLVADLQPDFFLGDGFVRSIVVVGVDCHS